MQVWTVYVDFILGLIFQYQLFCVELFGSYSSLSLLHSKSLFKNSYSLESVHFLFGYLYLLWIWQYKKIRGKEFMEGEDMISRESFAFGLPFPLTLRD